MVGPDVEGFRAALAAWFDGCARDLPWRSDRSAYRVWVSEIMLQQTRAEQARPYFERFIARFPDVDALAGADLDDVLVTWEGLGYYSRARNLHRAAAVVVRDRGGAMPDTYDDLRALPGIGDYTASAVSSIVFDRPHAVLDGNVIRVLTRLDADAGDVRRGPVRKRLRARAQELLEAANPGRHNEAMMELGAIVCTPTGPDCAACPVRAWCSAAAGGSPERYPFKSKKAAVPHHDIVVGVIQDENGRLLIQRRPEDAMLGGLWEFAGGKREPGEELHDACHRELREELGIDVAVGDCIARIKHAYSHFRITLHAFPCRILSGRPESRLGQPIRWVDPGDLDDFAFPRANRRLIDLLKSS